MIYYSMTDIRKENNMLKVEADLKKKKKIIVKPIDTNTDEVLQTINVLRQMVIQNDDLIDNAQFNAIMLKMEEQDEKDLKKLKPLESEEK